MPPYLTPLQIFENYKKANPQKCKGKSTTEICKLAGLSDKQIEELKNTSAWLFCFDKTNLNADKNFSMTQILGGQFSKTQAKPEQKKDIVKSVIEIENKTNKLTKDISALKNIVDKKINKDNVVKFLEQYKHEKGQSFFDLIASYKFVNDDIRKQIIIDMFDKLANAAEKSGQDVNYLKQLGISEIKYQFDKVGLINNDNVNRFFNALILISKKNKTNLKAASQDKYLNNFKVPRYSSKKENVTKILNAISGKLITYTLNNGNKVQDEYSYDNKAKKFILQRRVWTNNKNEIYKAATYYNGDENKLNGIFLYSNNRLEECHIFNSNGIEREVSYRKNGKYRYIKYGANGLATEETNVSNADNNKRKEKTMRFNKNGTEIKNWGEAIWDGICKQEDINDQIAALYALSPEELDFGLVDHTVPYTLEYCDDRTQKNVIKSLFEKLENLDNNSYAKFNELKKKGIDYIEKEKDPFKAWSCFIQAYGRITRTDNRRNIKNDAPINGKIDKDFIQGNFGTCWLTAAIKSLSMSKNGQEILNSTVKKDNITGDIIVTLKGAPKNQQVYRYTQQEINESSELSSGDGDERAVEMAFRDLFLKDNKFSKYADNTTNGNNLSTAYEILTGKEPKVLFENYDLDVINKEEYLSKIKNTLTTLTNKKNIVAQCSFSKNFISKYVNETKGITSQELYTGHAYCLKYVDKNFAYVINPWDTSKTEKIKREDFEKYCNEITIADV